MFSFFLDVCFSIRSGSRSPDGVDEKADLCRYIAQVEVLICREALVPGPNAAEEVPILLAPSEVAAARGGQEAL